MLDQELPSINEVASKFMSAEVTSPVEAPETPPTEAPKPVESAVVEPVKKDSIAAKFASLARREREARKQREEVENKAKDLETREKAAQERESRLKTVKRPLEALKELGFSYAQATEDALGGYKEPEIDPVEQKLNERLGPYDERLKKVEEAEARVKDQLAQIEQQKIQHAIREVNDQIKHTVTNGDYELIAAHGEEAIDIVREMMTQYYQTNKKVLTYQEACDRLEKYYVSYADKLAATNKIKSKYGAVAPSKQQSVKTEVKEPSPTLTNAHSSAPKATPTPENMSDDDLLDHLAKKIRYL